LEETDHGENVDLVLYVVETGVAYYFSWEVYCQLTFNLGLGSDSDAGAYDAAVFDGGLTLDLAAVLEGVVVPDVTALDEGAHFEQIVVPDPHVLLYKLSVLVLLQFVVDEGPFLDYVVVPEYYLPRFSNDRTPRVHYTTLPKYHIPLYVRR